MRSTKENEYERESKDKIIEFINVASKTEATKNFIFYIYILYQNAGKHWQTRPWKYYDLREVCNLEQNETMFFFPISGKNDMLRSNYREHSTSTDLNFSKSFVKTFNFSKIETFI